MKFLIGNRALRRDNTVLETRLRTSEELRHRQATEISRLQDRVIDLQNDDVHARLVRVTHHYECSEAENARLIEERERDRATLAELALRFPDAFPPIEVER